MMNKKNQKKRKQWQLLLSKKLPIQRLLINKNLQNKRKKKILKNQK